MLINVTIPVFNEEARLQSSLPVLHRFLIAQTQFEFELVIADNASVDMTLGVAQEFADSHLRTSVVHLEAKGRGRALKHVWSQSTAEVLTYMDVDLSTDVSALPELIGAVTTGSCDLAVGSRLLPQSVVRRGWRRECISRCYNHIVKVVCHTRFSDAQCGFKAIAKRAANELLPLVEDNGWFFDTELLVCAEALGYRIRDIPVKWTDDTDSRVNIMSTAFEDVKGLLRIRRRLRRWQREAFRARPQPIG